MSETIYFIRGILEGKRGITDLFAYYKEEGETIDTYIKKRYKKV